MILLATMPERKISMQNATYSSHFAKKVLALLIAAAMLVPMFSGAGQLFLSKGLIGHAAGPDAAAQEITPSAEYTATIENEGGLAYFHFVPSQTGEYRFVSLGNYDTRGYLYDGEMNELASDDDSFDGMQFCVQATLTAGESYYFGASYYDAHTGSFPVKLFAYDENGFSASAVAGPDIYAALSENAELEVTAHVDNGQVHYQWYQSTVEGWSPMEGADAAAVTVGPVTGLTDYYCRITDDYGNTAIVMFYVHVASGFTAGDTDIELSALPGETVTMTADASVDIGTLHYRWFRYEIVESDDPEGAQTEYVWKEIEGADASTLISDPLTDYTRYYCTVTDDYENSADIFFYLSVDTGFSAEAEQPDFTVVPGEAVTLKVLASANNSGLHYQWFGYDPDSTAWVEIEGADAASYTTGAITKDTGFYCYVCDDYQNGQEVFFNAHIDSGFRASVFGKDSKYVPMGETTTLKVKASVSYGALHYQWYKSTDENEWIPVDGATKVSFATAPITAYSEYECLVSDDYGNSQTVSFYLTPVESDAFEEPEWEWYGNKVAIVTFAATYYDCSDVIKVAEITEETIPATFEADGSTVYTARASAFGAEYSDTRTETIAKIDTVTLSDTSYEFDGQEHYPTVTVKDADGKALQQGVDFTVAYADDCRNPGTYTVTVTGTGLYAGTAVKEYTIRELPTYKVIYYPGGGVNAPATQTKTKDVDLTLTTDAPTKSFTLTFDTTIPIANPAPQTYDCTFTGWNTQLNGTGTAYAPGAVYKENAKLTVYAQWINPKADALPAVSAQTFEFLGWYTAKTGGDKVTAETVITKSMTLYGRWQQKTYKVIYYPGGGVNAPAAQTKLHGQDLTLATATPTKSFTITFDSNSPLTAPAAVTKASTFTGWNTDLHGSGTAYTPGEVYKDNAKLTVYAQWTTVTAGELPTMSAQTLNFLGWYTAKTGGVKITGDTVIDKNITLYAHWSNKTYKVIYYPGGGINAPAAQTKTHGKDLTLSSEAPTKSYKITFNSNSPLTAPAAETRTCTFTGWNTSLNGSGTAYASGEVYKANANLTVYAQWTNPTAGTLPTMTAQTLEFLGWFTGDGVQVTSDTVLTGNVTLYAHWRAK